MIIEVGKASEELCREAGELVKTAVYRGAEEYAREWGHDQYDAFVAGAIKAINAVADANQSVGIEMVKL